MISDVAGMGFNQLGVEIGVASYGVLYAPHCLLSHHHVYYMYRFVFYHTNELCNPNMADANKLQSRGATSRDVMFSNIFGSALPPGRSATMTSSSANLAPPLQPLDLQAIPHNGLNGNSLPNSPICTTNDSPAPPYGHQQGGGSPRSPYLNGSLTDLKSPEFSRDEWSGSNSIPQNHHGRGGYGSVPGNMLPGNMMGIPRNHPNNDPMLRKEVSVEFGGEYRRSHGPALQVFANPYGPNRHPAAPKMPGPNHQNPYQPRQQNPYQNPEGLPNQYHSPHPPAPQQFANRSVSIPGPGDGAYAMRPSQPGSPASSSIPSVSSSSTGLSGVSKPANLYAPLTTSNRTMSLTTGTARYDRGEVRSSNMTLSGRVIPQRQPNGLLMSQNSKSATALFGLKANPNSRSDRKSQHQRSTSTSSSDGGSARPSISSHSTILAASRSPMVYPAMLSKVAETFRQLIVLGDKQKNGLTYKNAFTGAEAVDVIAHIIKTPDRNLALLLGRALDAQKFFHDVTYDHRLRDTQNEVYQLNELIIDEKEEQQRHHQEPSDDRQQREGAVIVNGIFTLLAECYSPTCTRDHLCYSIACPRRLEQQARLHMKPQPGLKRAESRLSIHGDDEVEQKLWIHTVSKEVADSVDDKEKKRQEVICEVIYTERDFVKDLEYLRDFWIKPLSTTNIIPEPRREKFVRAVFSHILEVHSVNIKLAEALTRRQQLAPVVRQIGDVFLEHVTRFEPFVKYGANQLYGKYEFEREKRINTAFTKFVDDTERMKESRKLELNGYLTKPTTRLARYPLLLEAVLKHTSEDNPDGKNLREVISIIKDFLRRVNIETGRAENRFNLFQLSQSLVFNHGEYVDLKLTDENRQIIFKGFLKKRQDQKDNQGGVQVYLFDNSLLFIKIKTVNKREQLKVHRKPIPLELLTIGEGEEIVPKALAKRPTSSSLIPNKPALRNDIVQGNRFPITFQHLGRRGYDLTLYATTFIERKKWIEHIEQQKQVLIKKADIYTVRVLQSRHFSSSNRINCLSPFDGGRKLLFGTDDGIFMSDVKYGPNGPTSSSPVKVINIPNVTQVDVLDEYMTLLALSDKALYSWPLDCLESPNPIANHRRSKKVSGHINFYKVDMCLGRILVCTVKSGSTNSTVRVMEPFDPQPRSRKQQPLRRLLQSQSEGLKIFKEFYVPSETLSISFLRKSLCVGCAKGFEIVNLDTLESQSLLDPADTSLDFAIRKEALKPISIYRIHSDFLLNYSDFSFFVNGNGWRSRPEFMIYWEGLPSHFALSYPYLIAFDSNFIEIRHMETGDLVRVITGENIRFLHESTREIVYVHEDENGYDEVVSLDFWEKANTKRESKVDLAPTPDKEGVRNDSMSSNSDWTLVSNE